MQKVWWLHSFGALSFGIGVMLFARKGLQYADKVLIVLGLAWLLVFVAFRFIVGAQNMSPDDRLAKRGLRLITNYVIKQLYQQMFFFLVPLYASSSTFSLDSPNWWLAPLLLVCAVLSTMDLVFDNFIMKHRVIAASMYGLCMFAVLNLMLPLLFHVEHSIALLISAGAAPIAVALLSFRLSAVFSITGMAMTVLLTTALVAVAHFGRAAIPPAPMMMVSGAVGHGAPGEYECLPGVKRQLPASELSNLRCVSEVTAPGGVHESISHVWRHRGSEIVRVDDPTRIKGCDNTIVRSVMPQVLLPPNPAGKWTCSVETRGGQLVGLISFEVTKAAKNKPTDEKSTDEKSTDKKSTDASN